MKKMILGVLLAIIGLVGFYTIFLAVFIVEHTMHWYEEVISYGLTDLFWISVLFIVAGVIICVVEALIKKE